MTYEQALEWIHATPRFGQAPGLDRMIMLTSRLGLPQNRFPCVHIAGTNGKGSTAAMTAAVLQAAGYRTGLFTSPYLEDFRERIQVNGQPIPQNDLAQLADLIRSAGQGLDMTEFELVTAIGLMWFAQQQCDLVVLEVGLGGRFDATNIIPAPLVSVITSISLDHTKVLGTTVEQIAAEKAGILKPGTHAILESGQPEGVESVVRSVCQAQNIPLRCPPPLPGRGNDGPVPTVEWRGHTISLPLLGEFQRYNAAAALAAIEVLQELGWAIPDPAVRSGLESVRWPGRMELLRQEPLILLDCAHNPDALEHLSRWLQTHFAGRRLVTVMGMLADKDHHAGIHSIAAQSDQFFAVPPPSARALPSETIAREASEVCPRVAACPDVSTALEQALAALGPTDALVVCGSIPLVGEARQFLRSRLKETESNH